MLPEVGSTIVVRARLDLAVGLGGVDHRHADPVLDAAGGVVGLELAEQLGAAVGRQAREAHQRACCRRGRRGCSGIARIGGVTLIGSIMREACAGEVVCGLDRASRRPPRPARAPASSSARSPPTRRRARGGVVAALELHRDVDQPAGVGDEVRRVEDPVRGQVLGQALVRELVVGRSRRSTWQRRCRGSCRVDRAAERARGDHVDRRRSAPRSARPTSRPAAP